MLDDPRLRIFHIDTECYIIYLGKAADDYRPFLRVGNTPHLLEKAKSLISAVVVTESLTGNQLLEIENLQLPLNGETRYIGDPGEVNKLKQFLEEKDLPVEGYEYEEDEDSPKKGGAFVYFYRNGNLHIVHDQREIFDLHDREREDGHFVSRAERVVQFVKGNPFRYLPRDLAQAGFFLAGGKPYFFRDGRIGSIGIASDYIVDLGRYGFDPDLILWLVEDRLSEGLLNRFKRATVTKKDIRVATSELRKLQSAVSLFTASGLSCIVVHLEPGERKVFSGFTVERSGGKVVVNYPEGTGFPEALFPAGEDGNLPGYGRDIAKAIGYGGRNFLPVEGVPYRVIEKDDRDPAAHAKEYILDMLREFKDCADPSGQDFIRRIEPLCKALLAPLGNAAAKPLFESKDKGLKSAEPADMDFLLWNIRELSRLWSVRKGVSPGVKKHGARLAALIPEPAMPIKNETRLPVLGDFLRFDGEWYILYRLNGILTPLKLLQAHKSAEGIDKLAAHYNEAFYVTERERLARFIEGLTEAPAKKRRKVSAAGEAAPASPEDVLRRTALPAEAAAPREKTAAAGAGVSGAAKAAGKTSAQTAPLSGVPSGAAAKGGMTLPSLVRPSGSGGRGGSIGKIAVPLIAVLAAGGAAFFLIRSCRADEQSAAPAALGKTEGTSAAPAVPGSPAGAEGAAAAASGDTSAAPGSPAASGDTSAARGTPAAAGEPSAAGVPAGEAPRGETPASEASAGAGDSPGKQPGIGVTAPRSEAPEIDPESFEITILDVFYLVNETADKNGYRPIDRPEDLRPDPDWIYPANSFSLPDKSVHTVRTGDTLWGISYGYIRKTIREQAAAYEKIVGPYRPGKVPAEKKEEVGAAIRGLIESCRSENLRRFFEKKLQNLTEG